MKLITWISGIGYGASIYKTDDLKYRVDVMSSLLKMNYGRTFDDYQSATFYAEHACDNMRRDVTALRESRPDADGRYFLGTLNA